VRRIASITFVALVVLAGCAQGQDTASTSAPLTLGGTTSSQPNDGVGQGIGAATRGTEVGTSVPVSGTVTYQGYRITVSDGGFNDTRDDLRIPLEVENLGPEESTFYGDSIVLDTGGPEPISGSVSAPPPIAPGATTDAVVVCYLADGLSMIEGDGAALVLGATGHQQARIPLGAAGAVVTLDPVPQDTPADVTVGTVTLAPEDLEVRYDDVVQHTQAESGTAYLVLHAKATNASDDQSFYVGTDQATLALPDGTSGAADAFTSDAASIEPGATTDVWLRWTIPATLTGEATITFAADWGPDGAPAVAPMKITVRSS
jgi:hypothetical protein